MYVVHFIFLLFQPYMLKVKSDRNYLIMSSCMVKFQKLDTTGEESTDTTGCRDGWWLDVDMLIYATYDTSGDGDDNTTNELANTTHKLQHQIYRQ